MWRGKVFQAANEPNKLSFCSLAVCGKDTDNDGFTNGDELGDPCCRWQGKQADRHLPGHISHPDFQTSVPPFASCARAPSAANITLVGVFDGVAAAGDGGLAIALHLPPVAASTHNGALQPQCICSITMDVNIMTNESSGASAIVGTVSFAPSVDARGRHTVLVPLQPPVLLPVMGSPLHIKLRAASLHPDHALLNFNATVQPYQTQLTGIAANWSLVTALEQANGSFGSASMNVELPSINQPMLLPMALAVLGTVICVALVYLSPCTPVSVAVFCLNVQPNKWRESWGHQFWKFSCLVLLLLSTAASFVAYEELTYINLAEAALGRALGNSSLVLLFGTVVSSSHHALLHWAGVSFDRSIFGHKVLGNASVAAMFLHGAWMTMSAAINGVAVSPQLYTSGSPAAWSLGHWCSVCAINPLAGTLAALSSGVLICIPGRQYVRERAYACFYVLHVLGAVLTFVFAYLHLVHSGVNVLFTLVYPAGIIFCERVLLMLFHGVALSGSIKDCKVFGKGKREMVHFTVVQRNLGPRASPGQWMSMVVPRVSFLQHPVSVAGVTERESEEGEGRTIHFILRASRPQGQPQARKTRFMHLVDAIISVFQASESWSSKIVRSARDGTLIGSTVILHDLPLGRPSQPLHLNHNSKSKVFVAGGAGITAVLEAAVHTAVQPGHRATLVWAVRDTPLLEAVLALLPALLQTQARAAMQAERATSCCSANTCAHGSIPTTATQTGETELVHRHKGGMRMIRHAAAAASVQPAGSTLDASASIHPQARGELNLCVYCTSTSSCVPGEHMQPKGDGAGAPVDLYSSSSETFSTVNPTSLKPSTVADANNDSPASGAATHAPPVCRSKFSDGMLRLRQVCLEVGVKLTMTDALCAPRQRPDVHLMTYQAAVHAKREGDNTICVHVCGPPRLAAAVVEAVKAVNKNQPPPSPAASVGGLDSASNEGSGSRYHTDEPRGSAWSMPCATALLHVEQFGW